jgi:hypothetical protein
MTASPLQLVIESLLTQPTPEAVLKLQPLLLAWQHPFAPATHDLAGQFYVYLSAIRSVLAERQYPRIATALSLTAIGLEISEEMLAGEPPNSIVNLLTDGLRVALNTLSSLQYVRQWEPGFAAIHDNAVWNLYQSYWQLSCDMQPTLSAWQRTESMEELFKIVRDAQADSSLRLVLLVRLFQWGLVMRLLPLLGRTE